MQLTLYLLIFLLLFFSERLYFRIADKYNIIDRPNERSSHTSITLRGGGIIFYIGILIYGIVSGFAYPWFLAGLTLITAISMADDIRPVSKRVRLTFHFAAMALMFYQLGLFGGFPWWYIIIALIVCTGIINAFNFMDGINGMTGGYSLVVIASLIIINRSVAFIDERILWVSGISLLVFCFFNFRPKARCFAGDVGAVAIAYIILLALGNLVLQTGNIFYILLLAVYGVETILTICRRLYLKENIFRPHRRHVFQLLSNEFKNPQVLISTIYAVLQLIISLICIYGGLFNWWFFIVVVLTLSVSYYTVVIAELKNRKTE